ncbi:OsmC family protein [Aliiruegeria lutimaris]|uniref:OsmC-like protein n=1 Tax=Aliiruegeria lutimaris TaxID=571298 RepID=A0A1G9QFX7_9RHOB|nr:OsmC family protein [Aliiruegeria lutimaris]SDM09876.1 OsmC-like protein [Aliiruegeria lutimaris]
MSIEHIQKSVNGVIAYLKENPEDAVGTSPPVTAVMETGLRCRATGEGGQSVVTDMPEAVGGGGSAPSPGWLSRAALATCDATRITLRAAELGIALDTLEVTTDSVDDDCGLFGMDDSVRAGSLSVRTRVTIGAAGVSEKVLWEIVDYAVTHSPVADGCRRETPSTLEVTIA